MRLARLEFEPGMNNQAATAAFSALSHELRLNLLRLLVQRAPAGMIPSKLTELLGVPAATLSFHLRELTEAGLLTKTRQGRQLVYQPAMQTMADLIDFLTSQCCQGESCVVSDAAKRSDCRKA
jgi:DNA-binding transcriptional ArsR family regulator